MTTCRSKPTVPQTTNLTADQFNMVMEKASVRWDKHLAKCEQHCRCARTKSRCVALATGEDGFCDGCRLNVRPEGNLGERELTLLCAIMNHGGPWRLDVLAAGTR